MRLKSNTTSLVQSKDCTNKFFGVDDMRIFNNLENLKETLENSSITEIATGYDMTKEQSFFRATIKTNWEDLPKGIFLVRWWKGSPKNYNGYFVGGSYMTPSIVDNITIYEDSEIKFTINHIESFSIHYDELHRGNDYDIILKKLSY